MAFLRAVIKYSGIRNKFISLKSQLLNENSSNFLRTLISVKKNPTNGTPAHAASTQASSTPSTSPVAPEPETETKSPPRDELDLSFNDSEAAFKSKTTGEILRAVIVYQLCSIDFLVEYNMEIMKGMRRVLGDRLFVYVMKNTVYGHFVAGEDDVSIRPTLERLRSFGVKPILDYSVEEDLSQEEAEKREVAASVPAEVEAAKDEEVVSGKLPQYHVEKTFADRRYKVQSARTYFYLNEATCERNMETFLHCLEAIAEYDPVEKDPNPGATLGTGLTAIKLTALGRPQLLLQVSEVIMRTRQYMAELDGGRGNVLGHHVRREDLSKRYEQAHVLPEGPVKEFLDKVTYDEQGVIHLFPWYGIIDDNQQLSDTFRVPDLKTGKMVRLITQFSAKEEEMFRNMVRRVNTVIRAAKELDVRVMIDAEQTYFQPAISRITLEMMRKYNKEKAIVFNTYQCYLRDTYNEVITDLEQAKRQNFYFGAKLVRGAYLEQI
ncbi:UNVERIFIED_CONTAM: hypothetical protein PYX00_009582 [Menopon gallinae]|uniref:Proline dehydrogenase n=1 Tax=Menopon gallinae TaxID=328185 RepID=A0AAW2HBV8_9NEOP